MNALTTYDIDTALKNFENLQSKINHFNLVLSACSAYAVLALFNLIPMNYTLFILTTITAPFVLILFLRSGRELDLFCESQLTSFFRTIALQNPDKEAPEYLFELIGIENTFIHPSVKFITETYLLMIPRVKKVESFKRLMKGLDNGEFKELL